HFAAFLMCIAAMFWIARRNFQPDAGAVATVALATTPIVVWEAGAAYIEMGLALYVLLAIGAILEFRKSDNPRWLYLAGILVGLALSVKALALVPFTIILLLLAVDRKRAVQIAKFAAVGVVVGSPYYIKSWVWTNNPVYPFAYSIFSHSRYWNGELAAGY